MLEEQGNLWDLPAQARCITTNGFVKRNGQAVMGRGCAAEAAQRYPTVQRALGMHLKKNGNHVYALMHNTTHDWWLVSFPVKHHWTEAADLDLIARSCDELMGLVEDKGWGRVLLPRPGCGNGQLTWEAVKPVVEPLLDDRVVLVTY